MRVVERKSTFWDLGQCLEADVLIRDVCENDLAGVDLVDQELLHFTLCLVLLEVPLDNQEILVNAGLCLLDFFEEDYHVRGSLDLNTSPFARSEPVALLLERQVYECEGKGCLVQVRECQSEIRTEECPQ